MEQGGHHEEEAPHPRTGDQKTRRGRQILGQSTDGNFIGTEVGFANFFEHY
jgi:hypothetical protein